MLVVTELKHTLHTFFVTIFPTYPKRISVILLFFQYQLNDIIVFHIIKARIFIYMISSHPTFPSFFKFTMIDNVVMNNPVATSRWCRFLFLKWNSCGLNTIWSVASLSKKKILLHSWRRRPTKIKGKINGPVPRQQTGSWGQKVRLGHRAGAEMENNVPHAFLIWI